eukprot:TRINITY_DN10766_c0_g1_i5.p1 TRINITY_DN10766_c0_g1~~TRINITY_DN10766_c0_g1_i5.p1  ORF type:complete len:166 (-),score=54.78 TRINITY_DN10766_c0_g1_i5:82-579(-)
MKRTELVPSEGPDQSTLMAELETRRAMAGEFQAMEVDKAKSVLQQKQREAIGQLEAEVEQSEHELMRTKMEGDRRIGEHRAEFEVEEQFLRAKQEALEDLRAQEEQEEARWEEERQSQINAIRREVGVSEAELDQEQKQTREREAALEEKLCACLLYTSPSPRDS